MDPLQTFLLDPRYHDVLSVLKGFRNGMVYGAKIRAPHAAVMVFLFKGGSLRQKLMAIFAATRQHAQNLAFFVAIYKLSRCVLRRTNAGKERPLDPFLSGLLGGYIVFRENNNINQQIVLYLFSRIALGLFRVFVNASYDNNSIFADLASPQAKAMTWPVFASVCWGTVMYLHERHHHTLPLSLANSMSYLYQQSNQWDGLRTLFWHNT